MSRRIGPRMQEALAYIAEHPGTAILPVAEHVGPHGSRQFGYRAVHRLLDAHLVVNVSGSRVYKLVVRPNVRVL